MRTVGALHVWHARARLSVIAARQRRAAPSTLATAGLGATAEPGASVIRGLRLVVALRAAFLPEKTALGV